MDYASSIIAALDAGKLPSQQQISHIIDYFSRSVLSQTDPGTELSAQGKVVADGVSHILETYKKLGESKNSDNLLQKASWHLVQGDISETSVDLPSDITMDEAVADMRQLRSALRSLLQILWVNVTSEGTSILQDFASVIRLAMADAAEILEARARGAKEGLRDVEADVQEGKRDNLGRKKKSKEEEEAESDPKVKWEKGMDTVKDAGGTVIGAGQSVKETVEDSSEKTSSRLTDAYYKVCDRAQKDPQYHEAISTLFSTISKWLTKSLDSSESSSSHAFIHDPDPAQHVPKALEFLRTLAERFAGGRSLETLFDKARICAVDVRQDEDLRKWFDDFFAHVRKSLDQPGYARSEEAQERHRELRTRMKALRGQDSETAKKWKKDVNALKAEIKAFDEAIQNDADLKRVMVAHQKLGLQIEEGVIGSGKTGVQMAVDQAMWFWQDLFKVYAPRILRMLKDVPIPRTEYKDNEVEFVLEDIDISSFNLLPSHIFIRNMTDLDITTPASPNEASTTAVGTMTQIRSQAIQLTLKEASFYYHDKTATIGPKEFSGVMDFKLPEEGLDVDLKIRLIPSTPEGLKTRENQGRFHRIERVEVSVSEAGMELEVKECNHPIVLSLFKPIVERRLRETLEKTFQEQIRTSLEWVDSVAWDVSKRAEVFGDAGLPTGSSYMAALWSEIGRFKKMDKGGILPGWKATGTGLMKEGKESETKFAIGVEPQIIPGNKHAPKANFAEPLEEGSSEDAKNLALAAMDGGVVKDAAKGMVEEGKDKVRSFRKTVELKTAKEKKMPGWESAAFDV